MDKEKWAGGDLSFGNQCVTHREGLHEVSSELFLPSKKGFQMVKERAGHVVEPICRADEVRAVLLHLQ